MKIFYKKAKEGGKMNKPVRVRDEKGRYLPLLLAEKKEKSRKAVVRYQRTADGQNKIVGLEGFLTSEKIRELDPEVWRLWGLHEDRMYNRSGDDEIAIWMKKHQIVKIDQVYNDKDFQVLIAEMRACGKALSCIIKNVQAAGLNEIRVIEI